MWPYPKVIAHRGAGTLAPENTLAAMHYGWMQGYRAVEFDVMLSQDAIPVLMHDADFGRTVMGQGNVAMTAFADLQSMDAGAWFSAQYVGEPVPSYRQVLQFCRQHAIWMNVEIKPVTGYERITGEIVAQQTRDAFADVLASPHSLSSLPLFSSFSFDALMQARTVAPDIPCGLLLDRIDASDETWRDQLQQLDAISLHTNHRHLTAELTRKIKDAGYGVFCYTVNTPERAAEIIAWGVDGFCTDRIDLIAYE